MIETVKVVVGNDKMDVTKGITLKELAEKYEDSFKHSILLAKVNNQFRDLNYEIQEDSEIEFMDLTSNEGHRVFVNGLVFLLICVVKYLYGKKADVRVEHSLDKGLYIESNFKLTKLRVSEIKDTMKMTVTKEILITKVTIDRLDAIDYFEKVGDIEKVKTLKYNTNNYVTLYRLSNVYDYFYSIMPISTTQLSEFDLTYIEGNGFILRFPTIYNSDTILPYSHHPKMFQVFNESREWAKIMRIRTSGDLNEIVSSGKINDIIKIDETLQSNRLLNLAKNINDKKSRIKIVCFAGPSSSGKTTTTKKLSMYLESFGITPKVISMDDYYLERENAVKDKDGNYDFECLEALDLKLFNKQISALLEGKELDTPVYNFVSGKKEFTKKIKMGRNDILLIEGIHALDPKILTNIPRSKILKVYISPLTELNIDNHNRISTADNRLLRRMIRDARTRGKTVEDSIKAWDDVREGEEKYIFPYQDEADYTLNTASIYEMGVLRTYVEPLLFNVDVDSHYYEDAKRLMRFIRLFLPIPGDAIPEDAILREFIGESYFEDK